MPEPTFAKLRINVSDKPMRVDIQIPPLTKYTQGFPAYWLKSMFISRLSEDHAATNALASTYIRLVEAAMREYRAAAEAQKEFWNTHHYVNLSAMNRSIAHFEHLITNMHRAIRCLRALRSNKQISMALKEGALHGKPRFNDDKVAGRLMEMRDTVHHFEEAILDGSRVPEQTSYVLNASGPEILDDKDAGQTIKVLDRLAIGTLEVPFQELAEWLEEMGDYAQQITDYLPSHK